MIGFLTKPTYPKIALGIERETITAVSLNRSGGAFGIDRAASVDVPSNLIDASFTSKNIADPTQFRYLIEEALTTSGLLGQKRWSVSLPSTTSRTAIITLDTVGDSRNESEEIFEWKAEQTFGTPASELRITRIPIAPDSDGRTRYFATAVRLSVLDEYETIFEQFGWKAGLILPRCVSEAQWLTRNLNRSDSLLISRQWDGFTAILLRGEEPFVVRTVTCKDSEIDDEIYRLLLFYNDRYGSPDSGRDLERALLVGNEASFSKIGEIAREALGKALNILYGDDVGLRIPHGTMNFTDLAAPAGLAALGHR